MYIHRLVLMCDIKFTLNPEEYLDLSAHLRYKNK